MSQLNPLTGSILQTPVAQKQQTDQKTRQLRRAEELRRNVAARDDEMEHQVENTDHLEAVGDGQENPKQRQSKPKRRPAAAQEDDASHIDTTA
ncbi:MAG: hypothetical protein ABR964_11335 [Tepidisphaeraceae bacterium]|jgi:hypothetical protein